MKTKIFIFSILLSFSALSEGIIKKVYTDKSTYTYGETVYITLRAINTSSVADTIIFPDLCEAFPYIDDISYLVTFGIGCALAVSFREIPAQDSIEWVIAYPNSYHPELLMPVGQHTVFGHFQQITFSPPTSIAENTDTIAILIEEGVGVLSDKINQYAYYLEQNYPNPFNPSTTIQWELPEASYIKITLYNSLGEEVSTLVNENMNAGVHSKIVTLNSEFPGGVYFYQIKAGSFIQIKKMILLK